MKTTPAFRSFRRGAGVPAAALALCLGALVASAQSGSSPNSTDRPGNSGSTNAAADMPNSSTAGSTGATGSDMSSAATSASSDSLKHSDKRFIAKAAESNEKEEALSVLAVQRAQNPQVRSFAQKLISEHQEIDREIAQLAASKGVSVSGAATGASIYGSTSASGSTNATGSAASNSNTGMASANRSTGSSTDTTGTGMNPATGAASANGSMAATDAPPDRHYRNLAKKSGADFDKEYVDLMIDAHKDAVKLYERAAKNSNDAAVKAFASQHVSALQAHLDEANTLTKSIAE